LRVTVPAAAFTELCCEEDEVEDVSEESLELDRCTGIGTGFRSGVGGDKNPASTSVLCM